MNRLTKISLTVSLIVIGSLTIVFHYLTGPKFVTVTEMTNPLADTSSASLEEVQERLATRLKNNPNQIISITSNTFHSTGVFPGKPPIRLAWYDSVFAQVAASNKLTGGNAKVILSCDKFTKKTGRATSDLRDARYTQVNLLKRPSVAEYLSSCSYVLQWEAGHNQLDTNNVLRVIPPLISEPVGQQRKTRVFIKIEVPAEGLNKWARLNFDLYNKSSSLKISRIRVYGDEDQTWRLSWGDDFLKTLPGNSNYTHAIPQGTHYCVDFHTWTSTIWVRIDYTYPTLPLPNSYVEFRNLKFGDNFILDDEHDGGITQENMKLWNSLDLTPSAQSLGFSEEDTWAQGYRYLNWVCPMTADCTMSLAYAQMAWIDSLYGDRPEWGGYKFEWDEHYGPSGMGLYDYSRAPAKSYAWHCAQISKQIETISRKRTLKRLPTINGYAYGDMLVPYHGGREHYQGNVGSFAGVASEYRTFGGKPNIYWIEWGGNNPDNIVAVRDSLGLPWLIGFCRDTDQGASEFPYVLPALEKVGSSEVTFCRGGVEFGWWPHTFTNSLTRDSLMQDTHLRFLKYQVRTGLKQIIRLE